MVVRFSGRFLPAVVVSCVLSACGDDAKAPADGGSDAAVDHTGHDAAVDHTGHDAAASDAGTHAGSDAASPDAAAGDASCEGCEDFDITFEARVGDAVFDCAKSFSVGGAQMQFSDFRLYVSELRLLTADGGSTPLSLQDDGVFQGNNVALLDFENKQGSCSNGTAQTHTVLHARAKSGAYTGLSFVLGVPEALNHTDTATAQAPLDSMEMSWLWLQGRKFIKLEMSPVAGSVDGGGLTPFLVHIGSTACTGTPATTIACSRANRAHIALNAFDAATQKVVLDVERLAAGLDVTQNLGFEPGCMGSVEDPDCERVFGNLGLTLATGAVSDTPQTVFGVEAK